MKPISSSAAFFVAIAALFTTAKAVEPQVDHPASAYIKIEKQVNPHFPPRLLRRGVTHGEAVTALSIDSEGKLLDCLVSRYTHKEFADAAVDAIKRWQFKPLQSVGVVMEVTFIFRLDGVVAVERFGTEGAPAEVAYGDYAYKPCPPQELDQPPKLTHVVQPGYSIDYEKQGITGNVLVRFYIDETGHTRFAVPVTADNDVLGSLATSAVDKWQFERPTRNGKPVLVQATQRFAFQPER